MSTHSDAESNEPPQSSVFELRLRGCLGTEWSEWFGGMAVTHLADGDTLLTGPVRDQSELHGLLKRVRDLGIPLISVNRVEADDSAPASRDDQG